MANPTLKLFVTTPRGTDLKLAVDSVVVPGIQGEFGVLPGHRPLVAALQPGILRFRTGSEEKASAIGLGFVEVEAEEVRIVTSALETPEQLNAAAIDKEVESTHAEFDDFEGLREGDEYERVRNSELFADAKKQLLRNLS